jgi:hypothetical protein
MRPAVVEKCANPHKLSVTDLNLGLTSSVLTSGNADLRM